MKLVAYADGWMEAGGILYRTALGRGGVRAHKMEGDGASPQGTWPLREVLYRADRMARPETNLPVTALAPEDGWCDQPDDPLYNRQVRLPYAGRHEDLWRADHLYDVIVVVGYNDEPVMPGRGSAIFIHLASEGYGTTEGCAALSRDDLLDIVADLAPGSTITFADAVRK